MRSFTRFNFCPRCASPDIVIHMKNAIRCRACGYIYFHNTAAAVAGIVETDGKIVLIKRAHKPKSGYYDLPGGFVDYHETVDAALAREVKEECNIDITDLRYYGSFGNTYRYCGVTYFTADTFFLCRPVDMRTLRLSEESSGIVLAEAGEIDLDTLAFSSVRAALEKYFS